jgi:hypothetical protein
MGAGSFEKFLYPQYLLSRQGGDVFAEIDCQIVFAIRLIGCYGGGGYFFGNGVLHGSEALAKVVACLLIVKVAAMQFQSVVIEIEAAVFADDSIDGPKPGDMIAPAGRSASYDNNFQACFVQLPQSGECLGSDFAAGRKGVINVGEDDLYVCESLSVELRYLLHGWGTPSLLLKSQTPGTWVGAWKSTQSKLGAVRSCSRASDNTLKLGTPAPQKI